MSSTEFNLDMRDIMFTLRDVVGVDSLCELDHFKDFSPEDFDMMLNEAAKMAKEVLAPLNKVGDDEGCEFDPKTNEVKTPKGFGEALKTFAEAGWAAANANPEYGGGGLPTAITVATGEMFAGANYALTTFTALSHGAAGLIEHFGTDELKNTYVEKMYTGEWGGTMCLTEAGAGSAVGDLLSTAKPNGDHYLIEGTKIFITDGDHDLYPNIIHLVLARAEGSPPGIKGISLFAVPKYLPNPDGSIGEFNNVVCGSIEHKMGIHGTPTCVLNFGDDGPCKGWLIGEVNAGIVYMFQMMNEARLGVGMQGVSAAAAAYLNALSYAQERTQGVDITKMKDVNAPRVKIIEHPHVRRMLATQKALVEGLRGLMFHVGYYADLAEAHPDENERAKYKGFLDLLTPICKAYGSDRGFDSCVLSLQTYGGYGYVKEYPVEQYVRDVKIASIYEGTNGIQALDLLGRKVGSKGGMLLMNYFNEVNIFIDQHRDHPQLGAAVKALEEAKNKLLEITMNFGGMSQSDPITPVSYADIYLDMFGLVVCGFYLQKAAVVAAGKLADKVAGGDEAKLVEEDEEARHLKSKVVTANFHAFNVLPEFWGKAKSIEYLDKSLMEMPFPVMD